MMREENGASAFPPSFEYIADRLALQIFDALDDRLPEILVIFHEGDLAKGYRFGISFDPQPDLTHAVIIGAPDWPEYELELIEQSLRRLLPTEKVSTINCIAEDNPAVNGSCVSAEGPNVWSKTQP